MHIAHAHTRYDPRRRIIRPDCSAPRHSQFLDEAGGLGARAPIPVTQLQMEVHVPGRGLAQAGDSADSRRRQPHAPILLQIQMFASVSPVLLLGDSMLHPSRRVGEGVGGARHRSYGPDSPEVQRRERRGAAHALQARRAYSERYMHTDSINRYMLRSISSAFTTIPAIAEHHVHSCTCYHPQAARGRLRRLPHRPWRRAPFPVLRRRVHAPQHARARPTATLSDGTSLRNLHVKKLRQAF